VSAADPMALQPRRVLIIRQSALGDVTNTLPLLQLLRDRYPAAHIDYLTAPLTAPLLAGDPCVDGVVVHRRSRLPGSLLPTLWAIRRARYDLVIDLQSSRHSRWLAWASGASVRLGGRSGPYYTHPVHRDTSARQVCGLLAELLAPIGLAAHPLRARFPDPPRFLDAGARVLRRFDLSGRPYVVLNSGHSPRWDTKRWPLSRWAALARHLSQAGYAAVLSGAASDRPLTQAIAEAAPVVSLAGQTDLWELAGLMARARAVVSTDSGPMHVAAMVETPVVALFGPTNPVPSAPFGPHHRILHHRLACSYCFKKRCPLGHHACLDHMSVDEVWSALGELLAAPAVRPQPRAE